MLDKSRTIKSIYSIYLITGTDDLYNEFLFAADLDHYPEEDEIQGFLDGAPKGFDFVAVERTYTRA